MQDKNTVRDERTRHEVPTALLAGPEAWWSTITEYQHEVGQFISDRLAKDAEAIRQTLTCRDWAAALEIRGRWVDETLRDYSEEMKKLTGIHAKTTASTVRERHRT